MKAGGYGSRRSPGRRRSSVSFPLQPLSFRVSRPQISAMVSQSPDIKITAETPIRAPSAVPVDDAVLPFEVDALDLRGRLTRLGPALDDILHQARLPASGRQTARRGDRADDIARLVAEVRRPLHPADPDRRPGVVLDRRFPGARSAARLCALRRRALEGGPKIRRAARQGPSRHDHRPGPGHEPLPGPGRARRRQSRRRRT